jgi:hypothetical protein
MSPATDSITGAEATQSSTTTFAYETKPEEPSGKRERLPEGVGKSSRTGQSLEAEEVPRQGKMLEDEQKSLRRDRRLEEARTGLEGHLSRITADAATSISQGQNMNYALSIWAVRSNLWLGTLNLGLEADGFRGRDLLRVNWEELKAKLKREIGLRGVKFVGPNTEQKVPRSTAGSSEADARGRGPGILRIEEEHHRRRPELASESAEGAREEPMDHIEGDGEAKSDEEIMANTEVTAENNQVKTAVCKDTVLKRIKADAKFQVAIYMAISYFATFAILGLGYCWRYGRPGDGP